MNSLASNVHIVRDLNPSQAALPVTLAGVIASLFSASGRDRLAAATGGDASDGAFAGGL